jgi:hypothetical protein
MDGARRRRGARKLARWLAVLHLQRATGQGEQALLRAFICLPSPDRPRAAARRRRLTRHLRRPLTVLKRCAHPAHSRRRSALAPSPS